MLRNPALLAPISTAWNPDSLGKMSDLRAGPGKVPSVIHIRKVQKHHHRDGQDMQGVKVPMSRSGHTITM